MLTIISTYSIFTVPPMIKWNNVPMIVFMAIAYLLSLVVTVEYLRLTITDPVDRRVKGERVVGDTKLCSRCNVEVGVKTFHCLKCKRCTD